MPTIIPAELERYQIGGFVVALAARIAGSSRALAVHLDRPEQPTDRYREVEAYKLRRVGAHLAEIKAAIATLPKVRFPWDAPALSQEALGARRAANGRRDADKPTPRASADGAPRGGLFARNAIPSGDE